MVKMIQAIFAFFDKLEDKIRGALSRTPILYTFIGGVAMVLFWRGVWHTADILQAKGGWWGILFYEPTSLVIVVVVLLLTGLFVSYFIGDTILISGLKGQKKMGEKTEKEVKQEGLELLEIQSTMEEIKKEMGEVKDLLEKKE